MLLGWLGCGSPAGTRPAISTPEVAPTGDWSYTVTAEAEGRELQVQAELAAGSGERLVVEEGAELYLREVERSTPEGWQPLERQGGGWFAPSCVEGCRLRYRFLLGQAAQDLADLDRATSHHGALFAPPSTWLLHPAEQGSIGRWRLRVEAPAGLRFVSGLWGTAPTYEAATDDLATSPYSAFGRFELRRIGMAGGSLELALPQGAYTAREQVAIEGWARRAAQAVGSYYGRFPVERAALFVLEGERPGVNFGRTLGNGGASILVSLGHPVHEDELWLDWVLPHELVHLAFPSMAPAYSWLEEGIATYVEPIARARVGQLAAADLWRDFLVSMPQGQPEPGDEGLDRTPTWGRTYWGGAIFCLLADVQIRQKTGNRRSLDDALRAILGAGGDVARRWPLERALAVGDEATGTTVLRDLHRLHGAAPVRVDLEQLWRQLGVRLGGGRARFDEDAPLAEIRRSITRPALP